MKILALEIEADGVRPEQYHPHLKDESGKTRGLYFRPDRSEAVRVLECEDVNEARQILESRPWSRKV